MKKSIFILTLFLCCSQAFSQKNLIQSEYVEYADLNNDQYRAVFVWNTKTGETARYYYADDKTWKKSTVSLPENPLGDVSTEVGEIMMNYTEYSDRINDQYRAVFVWNTKTGKTARYYYADDKTWKKSSVSLPENPLD